MNHNPCKQCGYWVVELRDDDFCCDGCRDVYAALAQLQDRFAMQEGH